MALIAAAVQVNRDPLQRAFVERLSAFGTSEGFALTDRNGSFSFNGGFFNEIDVRIYAQNSVLRVLNGDRFNIAVSFTKKVKSGDVIQINSEIDHFQIANKCLDVYDTVWRQFRPYSRSSRGDFPLGRKSTLRATFAENKRLELSYPDRSPSTLAWVEPSGLSNSSFPLVHIKHRDEDKRLFGDFRTTRPPQRADASLLPHEMGHAFHFSSLLESTRGEIEGRYLRFLLDRIAAGLSPTHNFDEVTTPFIAFVEAVGIFSERFFFFKKRVRPDLEGRALRNAFISDELSPSPSLPGVLEDSYDQAGVLNDGTLDTNFSGNDVEGAVYGAIYLDFARRIGLRRTVNLVLESNATTFASFRTFVHGKGDSDLTRAIDAVKRKWDL